MGMAAKVVGSKVDSSRHLGSTPRTKTTRGFCPVQSSSACVAWEPVGRSINSAGQPYGTKGPLPVTTKARIRQPGSGPGAWVSHCGDTSGGKGLFPDEGSTGQRLASPWFGSSTVILPKPVGRRTPSRLWTVVSCSCRKPPRVRRVVRCHTWGWSRMAIVRLLLRELEGSGTVVVAVEPLAGGVGLRVGGWESKPSNRSTQ